LAYRIRFYPEQTNLFFMAESLVRQYCSGQGIREWRRLVRDVYHRLEFDTTMHSMLKYLPKGGLVLDAGGGLGRYAIELGRVGYDVVLVDLSPEMLEIAEKQVKKSRVQKRVSRIVQGSIDDLSVFEDEVFDAVVCLGGPLSHIVDEGRRQKTVDELIRVAKKGSPVFVSVIGRMAVLVNELVRFPEEIELDIFPRMRDTRDYFGGYGFAPCHFYQPEDLKKMLEKRGLGVLEMVRLEGLASGHQKETNGLAKKRPKAWKIWWQTHLKTCTHEVSVGISEHFMAVCRKP
jgi:ubiquinone/menaquinone biosynthesis C-methylase UbiE